MNLKEMLAKLTGSTDEGTTLASVMEQVCAIQERTMRRTPTGMCLKDESMQRVLFCVTGAATNLGLSQGVLRAAMRGSFGPDPMQTDEFRKQAADQLIASLIYTLQALDELRIDVDGSLPIVLASMTEELDRESPFLDTDPPDDSALPSGTGPFS